MKLTKSQQWQRRARRVRKQIGKGTATKPRLTVFRSNTSIYAQIIDDTAGKVIASASSVKEKKGGSSIKAAQKIGAEIAKKAQEKKVSTVVFDRSGYTFHGRVKALADAAREAGLQF